MRPHPVGARWKYAFLLGIIVFFILFGLAPFSFSDLDIIARLWKALAFGFITTLSMGLNLKLCQNLFPSIFNEDKWTIGHELLFNLYDIFLIGFWNTLFLKMAGYLPHPFLNIFWRIEWNTYLISIIPVLVLVIIKNGETLKKQLKRSETINDQLISTVKKQDISHPITFFSENNKPELQLLGQEIIFIKSEGNYVEIFFQDDSGKEIKHLLRNRMKNIRSILPDTSFFQCHKSYIVNTQRIIKVEGNARDLRLTMRGSTLQIPVSRGRAEALVQFFKS